MSEIEIPKLYIGTRIIAEENSFYIALPGGKFLTEAQAAEVIRRAEAYPGLANLLKDAQQYIRPLDPKYKEIGQALKVEEKDGNDNK